mgnify:CR=1 FL=1
MYIKIDKYDFSRAFASSTYSDNFSRDGLNALFDYFQGVESDIGEEFQLDVTAIACEWSEITLSEALYSYSLESLDNLREQTHVIVMSGDESEPETCKILMANY